jgi:hypothetical protein
MKEYAGDKDIRLKEAQRDRERDGATPAQTLFRRNLQRESPARDLEPTVTYRFGEVIRG